MKGVFLKQALYREWVVLLMALLIGGIHVSHHVLLRTYLTTGQIYHPITFEASYDEAAGYGSRAKAFYTGQFPVVDTALLEHEKDRISPMPPLNPIVMGGLGRILGSLDRAFIVSDFLFPALIFIFLYILLFELTGRKTFSIVGAAVFMFVPRFALAIPPLSMSGAHELFRDIVPSIGKVDELYFSRFDYPQITYLFYIPAFFFILRALKRDAYVWTLSAGVSFGLLFYTYFYDWAYMLTALVFMCVFFILGKRYNYAQKIFAITGIGFLVSVPYWINFVYLHALPQYSDLIRRSGVEISRSFRFRAWTTYVRSIGFVGMVVLLFRRNDYMHTIYLVAFLLSPFIVLNMQVFAGFNPQPDHWHRVQFLPFFLAMIVMVAWICKRYVPSLFSKNAKRAVWTILVLFLGLQFHGQIAMSRIRAPAYTIDASHEKSYAWLIKHTPAGSVVGALSPITNIELILYTHNHSFLPTGLHSLASNEEIWDRVVILGKLFGMREENFIWYVNAERNLNFLFHNVYRSDLSLDSFMRGDTSLQAPEEIIQSNVKRFKMPIAFPIPYTLDYLYTDERLGENMSATGTVVYSDNGITIYSLRAYPPLNDETR
ncbi:MAG: hypothetical protein G01um101448_115 [Parcubacteria group bacterium Gr01-1014_48]|nr:MAG: hypothetical protein Greene041614_37 [Parcubacteria group bacterium Greene0416_14]TSC74474.1 MAG: hypothetical protein G01um101448_115 [Parcubacteria group bacterium Gr01-1014_48]TSD01785.1 MAG: hypothetical protein Greene101415_43 [Parcubacteria group bacterium Greene1014_15]TSD08499.1 MAG: hypothetical protein Greene07144_38 [Parcubacteria group bacterium Greene0714_4]